MSYTVIPDFSSSVSINDCFIVENKCIITISMVPMDERKNIVIAFICFGYNINIYSNLQYILCNTAKQD